MKEKGMDTTLERIITIMPAFDGRNAKDGGRMDWRRPTMQPDDGTNHTNYGIGGCELMMILKGPLGAVQFRALTDWYPPHVQNERHGRSPSEYFSLKPMGTDVGYHSPKPLYEDQRPMGEPGDCPYVPEGCSCYYDGSSLQADEWVRDILLRKGSDGIWEALEAKYRRLFEDEEGEK